MMPAGATTPGEAERVQRYHDRLMDALQARDRVALACVKQEVLDEAFGDPAGSATASPTLRRALRELCWRMAGMLVRRGARKR